MEKQRNGMGVVRVSGVPPTTVEKLENVSKHTGISLSGLVKIHIPDILAKYPPHYQEKYKE